MVIAGLDPSLRNFGMVKGKYYLDHREPPFYPLDLCLQETRADTKKSARRNSQDYIRCRELRTALLQFLQGVDMVFVEMPEGSQSARGAASYGMCLGLLASLDISLIPVSPIEVKQAAVGSKTATKAQMIEWATTTYPNLPWLRHRERLCNKNEHLADAMGAIHAGLMSDQFQQLLTMQRNMTALQPTGT